MEAQNKKIIIGWREWVGLPTLQVARIKAKIDTGARTSALHAFSIESFKHNHQQKVRFHLHPKQHNTTHTVICEAMVIDRRWITDSGGHKELRYIIETPILLGHTTWQIEIALTNRDTMGFRMLLGRTAIRGRAIIDPNRSFLIKKNTLPTRKAKKHGGSKT